MAAGTCSNAGDVCTSDLKRLSLSLWSATALLKTATEDCGYFRTRLACAGDVENASQAVAVCVQGVSKAAKDC